MTKYPRRRKQKLSQQGVESGDLTLEAFIPVDVTEDRISGAFKRRISLYIRYVPYILLGFSLGVLSVGLILLIGYSC